MIQSWMYTQLIKIRKFQPELVDQIIDDTLSHHPELKWLIVIGAYLDKDINLGKASELLGIHRRKLQEKFIKQGIPLRLGSETQEEAQAELDAISQWNLEFKTKVQN